MKPFSEALLVFALIFSMLPFAISTVAFGQDPSTSMSDGYLEKQLLYAKAYRDLAKVELQVALEVRKEFPAQFSQFDIQRKRNKVALAEELLRLAEIPAAERKSSAVPLKYATEKAALATSEYEAALKKPDEYSVLRLEQLRLTARVADLRLQLWNYPTGIGSLFEQMRWQMERLSEEIVDLQQRVEELEQN